MPFGCLLLIVAIAMLWGSGQQVYEHFTAGSLKELSYQTIVETQPTSGWVHVKDASWKAADAIYFTNVSRIGMLYVPATPDTVGDGKVHVLVKIGDSSLAEYISGLNALSDKDFDKRMKDGGEKILLTKHPIQGTLAFGIEDDEKGVAAVRGQLGDKAASDLIIVKQGETPPELWPALLVLLGGLAMAGGFVWIAYRSGDEPEAKADA